jgi:hypothetical protein
MRARVRAQASRVAVLLSLIALARSVVAQLAAGTAAPALRAQIARANADAAAATAAAAAAGRQAAPLDDVVSSLVGWPVLSEVHAALPLAALTAAAAAARHGGATAAAGEPAVPLAACLRTLHVLLVRLIAVPPTFREAPSAAATDAAPDTPAAACCGACTGAAGAAAAAEVVVLGVELFYPSHRAQGSLVRALTTRGGVAGGGGGVGAAGGAGARAAARVCARCAGGSARTHLLPPLLSRLAAADALLSYPPESLSAVATAVVDRLSHDTHAVLRAIAGGGGEAGGDTAEVLHAWLGYAAPLVAVTLAVVK